MSELSVAIGIIWAVFLCSVTIAIALAIAWGQFGRPRHALTWAFAFAMSGVRALENFATMIAGPNMPLRLAACVLLVIPAPLFAIGARQRAGLPDRRYQYLGSAVLVAGFAVISQPFPWLARYARPVGLFYLALVLADAANVLRPRLPGPQVAEWAMTGATALLCVLQLILAGLTCAYDLSGSDPTIGLLLHGLLMAVIPPCAIALGVSAILLVASDLAAQLRRIAACDPLTGLYNRRGFQERAVPAIARARRNRHPVSLVIGDIDHFKRVNDEHGHAIGDQTLILVGRRLSAGARADDLVGRIGGEEFALLMLDSRGYEAAQTMDRIRTDIARRLDGDEPRHAVTAAVTISFGIAEVRGDGAIEAMLADAHDRADRALYRAKIGGRDRVTLGDAEDPEPERLAEGLADA